MKRDALSQAELAAAVCGARGAVNELEEVACCEWRTRWHARSLRCSPARSLRCSPNAGRREQQKPAVVRARHGSRRAPPAWGEESLARRGRGAETLAHLCKLLVFLFFYGSLVYLWWQSWSLEL